MNPESTPDELHAEGPKYWAEVARLWDRATGGRDVAARPTDNLGSWPVAQRAAGVDQAIEWIRSPGSSVRLLFLVGGPGAGKSHAAAYAVRGLSQIGRTSSSLAERNYRFGLGDQQLVLVNDATIPSDAHATSPLMHEIQEAIAGTNRLMACVNRGILVEESMGDGVSPSVRYGSAIIRWLQRDQFSSEHEGMDGVKVVGVKATPYLWTALLHDNDEAVAEVCVVFVDACSLLEPAPTVTHQMSSEGKSVGIRADEYRVTEMIARQFLDADASSAGALAKKVIGRLYDSLDRTQPLLDPFDANVRSLQSPGVQSSLLSVLRAAEIISGSGFTFRDLWGAIARSVVGDAPGRNEHGNPESLIAGLQPTATAAISRFEQIQDLAGLRYSQAIYGVGKDNAAHPADRRANPVTRLTQWADPVVDSIPGHFSSGDGDSGWATPIVEAFSGPVSSGSPLETLVSGLSEDDLFNKAVTDFDREVDRAFIDVVRDDHLPDHERMRYIAWYGRYLTRLYATANGISAFRLEVQTWTQAWAMAPALPTALEKNLKTLFRPARDPRSGSSSVIPVLDSRATPVVGESAVAKIALESESFELRSSVDGDELFLEIVEQGVSSPLIRLDYALVRQAMSCGAGWVGVTEVSEDTSPRLERFRSSRLIPAQLGPNPTYVVIDGLSQFKIQVKGKTN